MSTVSLESGHSYMCQWLQQYEMDPAMLLVSMKPSITSAPAEAATEAEFIQWMVQLHLHCIAMEVDFLTQKPVQTLLPWQ